MSTQDSDMDPLAIAIKAVEIYATMHPRPAHVSQKQAAEMLSRSVPTVRDLVRSGQLRMNRALNSILIGLGIITILGSGALLGRYLEPGTPSHTLLAGLTFANFLLLGAVLLRTPARQPPALLARQALRSAPYLAGLYSGSTLALWGAVAWAITF